jgi:PST family polysaccharide transporter/lipopolysaccharide exporter
MVKFIVLARLLGPEDFGLFGLVQIAISIFEEFSKTGIERALIHRPDLEKGFLDVGWTIEAIRGALMGAALFLISPFLTHFFHEPRILPLLQIICLNFFINGLVNTGVIFFQKELLFRKQFFFEVLASLSSLIVGVALAYRLRSVWALILSDMAWSLTRFLASYAMHSYRPKWNLDVSKVLVLLHYGKWVFATSIVILISGQFDNFMVGKMLDAEALGLYAMAYSLSVLPLQEITYTISRVAFPSFAKLQNDPEKIKKSFDRFFQMSTYITIPACVGMAVCAPLIISVVLGAKWNGVILPLQILMAGQVLKSIASTGSPLFYGIGKPRYEFSIQLARAVGIFILIFPLIKMLQINGAAIAVIISATFMLITFLFFIFKISFLSIKDISLRLFPIMAGILAMSAAIIPLTAVFSGKTHGKAVSIAGLLGIVALGACLFFVFSYLAGRKSSYFTIPEDMASLFQTLTKNRLFRK